MVKRLWWVEARVRCAKSATLRYWVWAAFPLWRAD